ncbi:FAD-dependent oxidoreductase [Chlorobium ferrooxidans]|uniref:Amine oxidase:Rieske (2Fe-2S) region:FAD dependent oxidoreductase n=1 Tax=Chlorobium ferrooxidans DSM 13031 TaxID=377431 RepID=Q0YUN4_9CHLB|nr:FAD-dependent oxidoreductase [Chlorobium ferrooxidans]EAT59998.1 Amine oxidase:Rieske (2Fe-2S) region:FAD dependent oxidoreductase [Chlorobium ferrooxidans DSM 13031]
MERREFIKKMLKRTAIGAGVATAGAAGLVGYYQPRKELYGQPGDTTGGKDRLEGKRKVVVIGGGLAGISSALELARKGFEVTLIESSASLGGKLTGWDLDALGERFPVEHGFHGFFDQYYNLNEIFASAGVKQEVFSSAPGYPVIFKNFPEEIFGQTPKLFPLNVLSIIVQSKRLDMAAFLKNAKGLLSTVELFRYQYDKTFRKYDGIDFMTYCQRGDTLKAFVDTVLHPFADATMNRMEVLSAAEALRYFHFYFMSSPEGLAFRITNRDCMSALITPLEVRLKELGVTLRKGNTARRIVVSGERVSGVVVESPEGGTPLMLHLDPGAVPQKSFAAFTTADGVPVMVGRNGSGYAAYDGRCTHMGCTVTPDAKSGGFLCPCHAGRFDSSGNPVSGPPKAPLAPLAVTLEGNMLVVKQAGTAGKGAGEVIACDYCVLASNVRGTRELVKGSLLNRPEFESQVDALGEADPYAVFRLWLDRPLASSEFPFYTVSGYTYTDSISIYSDFQEPFISWAKKTGGCVIELHAYAIAPGDIRPEAEIRAAMLQELHTIFPETVKAVIRHELFMQQSNFSRWAPGDHAHRPGIETPFSNLFLAGDWVRVDAPVFLMEAAAFTGRMAANAIFRQESVTQVPLPIVPMQGLFA